MIRISIMRLKRSQKAEPLMKTIYLSMIRISIMRLKPTVVPYPDPGGGTINDKNLNYEIETIVGKRDLHRGINYQ